MLKHLLTGTVIALLPHWTGISQAQTLQRQIPSFSKSAVASKTHTSKPSVQLSLVDIVKLVLQSNRDLKNAALDRIVQKQELKEAEHKFKPTFTPSLSLGINHQFLSNGSSVDGLGGSSLPNDGNSSPVSDPSNPGAASNASSVDSSTSVSNSTSVGNSSNSLRLGDRSTLTYGGQLSMNWLSPLGTKLSVTASPFSPQSVDVNITQPLLRGAGTRVNRASIKTARLGEQRNALALQQTVIDKLTETVIAYRNLIKTQEAVRIQELALQSKHRQLEGIQALVDVGRKSQAELIQTQKSITDTEQSLVLAQNSYAQANSELLKLIESERIFKIVIPQGDIDTIRRSQLPPMNRSFNELLPIAYQNRSDYQQTQLDIDTEKLNLLLAKDNQRWNLDLQSNTNLSENPQTSASLTLSRTLGEQSSKTERIRREVGVQKLENKRTQLTYTVRQEVSDRLRDVNSALVQVSTSQRAREFAQQQLDVAQTLFRRRGGQVTLFEIIQKQDELISAQNSEIQAKIEYLNALTNLEKAVGLTLVTWKNLVGSI